MSSYADLIKKVESNLKFAEGDPVLPEPSDIDEAIDEALHKYSQDRPRRAIVTLTGDGGNRYPLPDDWDQIISQITRVEYFDRNAATDGDLPNQPAILKAQDVLVWDDGTGEEFQFQYMNLKAAAGSLAADRAVVQYSATHTMNQTTSTVPNSDVVALSYLATSRAAWKAAGQGIAGASFNAPNPSGILGTLRTQSDLYAKFAKDMLKLYYDQMNIDPDESKVPPVLVSADVDLNLPWITHRNR